jgi:hypothetical protein
VPLDRSAELLGHKLSDGDIETSWRIIRRSTRSRHCAGDRADDEGFVASGLGSLIRAASLKRYEGK